MSDKNITHLIVLTIGPVQGYISQARRTQDLFQGSRILSYLAGKGAETVANFGEANLIYPYMDTNNKTNDEEIDQYGSIPNRIVIAWDGDADGARECAKTVSNKINDVWEKVSSNTRDYFLKDKEGNWIDGHEKATKIWIQQEKSWLERYWVVVAYDTSKSYAANINAASAALGARKLLRNFSAVEEIGRKDSITGEHAVLHGQDITKDKEFWQERRKKLKNPAMLSPSERLGAISTTKRFAHEPEANRPYLEIEHRYPSTSSIAVAPFKYDVIRALFDDTNTESLESALFDFINALLACFESHHELFITQDGRYNPEHIPLIEAVEGFNMMDGHQARPEALNLDELTTQFMCIDGDYLYDDTLITKTIVEYRHDDAQPDQLAGAVSRAKRALQDFIRLAGDKDIAPPQAYLAILSMDGDKMGRTIGSLESRADHRRFSETLANFARTQVKKIVEQDHLGRLVYAGGDDVLALLPVRHALPVAEQLRTEFTKKLTDEGFTNHKRKTITASTGIAFVHHTHDLQSAVRASKSAEKEIAKTDYDRNAIGVRLLRRSGEPRMTGSNWVVGSDDDEIAILSVIDVLQTAFFYNLLGRNLPYDMARIAYQMDGPIVPAQARRAELKRVIHRRLANLSNAEYQDLPKDATATLGADYETCQKRILLASQWLMEVTPKVEQAQRWVELARFIAQKESDR